VDEKHLADRTAALRADEIKSPKTDRAGALRLARRLGCEGAHEMPGGGWAPCPTHDAMLATVKDGAAGFKRWRQSQGKDGERERGIAGIETLPSGGLVSGKSLLESEVERYRSAMGHMGHDEEYDEESETHHLNGRQKNLTNGFRSVVENYGKFDQGTGPDGAHYVAKSPFASEGLLCSNCALYEGPRACEIVEGDIAPEAVCKFWVIPGDLIEER